MTAHRPSSLSRPATWLALCIASIVGAVAGGYAASRYWIGFYSEFMGAGLESRYLADAAQDLALSADLQSRNHEQALDRINVRLDADILALGAIRRTALDRARVDAMLHRISEFRAHTGYLPDPAIAPQVRAALAPPKD